MQLELVLSTSISVLNRHQKLSLSLEDKKKVPLPAYLESKSLVRSHAGSHFYGKNITFGLIFGRLALLKKYFWVDYEQR